MSRPPHTRKRNENVLVQVHAARGQGRLTMAACSKQRNIRAIPSNCLRSVLWSERYVLCWNRHILSAYNNTNFKQANICFNADQPILDVCVLENAAHVGKLLLLAMDDGSIYRVKLQSVESSKSSASEYSAESRCADGDIFQELLEEEEIVESIMHPSTLPVISVNKANRVQHLQGVVCIRAVHNLVFIVSRCYGSYHIHYFLQQDFVKTGEPSKTIYPLHTESYHFLHTKQSHSVERVNCWVIHPQSSEGPHTAKCDTSITMTSLLFGQLFGRDLHMCDSPVILLCLPSGHVYAIPVKGHPQSDWASKSKENCWLMYSLGEPVSSVCVAKKEEWSESQGKGSMLFFVGSFGKVVSVSTGENKFPIFKEHLIPGPVLTCCLHKDKLVFSTYKDLFFVSVDDICVSSCESLGYCRITGIVSLDSQGEGPVLGCTSTSCLKQISVKKPENNRNRPVNGNTIKDLLSSIGSLAEKSKKWQRLQVEQREILSQVNLAAHLITKLSSKLTCDTRVHHCDMGSYVTYQLECRLTNHTDVSMHRGWSFVVDVRSGNQHSGVPLETKSIALNGFDKGGFVILHLPLKSQIMAQLPLIISPCLVYDIPRLQLATKKANSHDSVLKIDQKTVILPLKEVSLDIIHFLHSYTPLSSLAPNSKLQLHGRDCDWQRAVLCIAENRPFPQNVTEVDGGERPNYSSSLAVPEGLLKQLQQRHKDETGRDSESVQILQHLLRESSTDPQPINQPRVKFVTPDRHIGTITVQRTETSGTEVHQITFQTSDLATFCRIRAALLNRCHNEGFVEHQGHVPTSILRKALLKIQDIREELFSLIDTISVAEMREKTEQQTVAVYKRVRELPPLP